MAALRLLSGWDEDTAHELTRTVNGCAACSCTCTPRSNARWPATASKATPPWDCSNTTKAPTGCAGRARRVSANTREGTGSRARRSPTRSPTPSASRPSPCPARGRRNPSSPNSSPILRRLRDRRTDISRQVEELLADAPLLTVLTSMPGIAARTASQILLAIGGDIGRFKDAAHLAAYAGIAPVTRQSGTSIHGERPARGGNKRLKNALFQTAFAAIRLDPESRAYYDRQTSRRQTPQRGGHVPGTQTMQTSLYSMLRNGTLYQPGGTHTTTTTPPRTETTPAHAPRPRQDTTHPGTRRT